jgi:hypothetical protein
MRIEEHSSYFFTGVNYLKFCDIDIRVPNKIEEYLERCYGDIKFDPPLEKQYPHHFLLQLDFSKPYTCYKFDNGKVVKKQ